MLIALTIAASILAVIILAYTTGNRILQQEMTRTDLWLEGNHSLAQMTKDLRKSLKIVTAEAGRISFWLEDLNLNYTMEATELVSYSLAGAKLIRTASTESITLADRVASINFNYDNPGNPKLVVIRLTLGSGESISSFESKARLRNK